ncbi:hypothetical protein M0813_09174 [Anaeramoeba flamelloides]|uniref:Uncharacterized protein n=1 Tax=Anaeramoeba flamelloides TaxID=1746091 RepID=A0ABQ8X639_9EUKA|nr:hypothetical protein M0813_09174 [Anaeramoeba flamelloides]
MSQNNNFRKNQDCQAVGPFLYPTTTLFEVISKTPKRLVSGYEYLFYVPFSELSYENEHVKKRWVWANENKYHCSSDVVSILIHSSCFIPNKTAHQLEGIIVTFKILKEKVSKFIMKRKNGIRSRFSSKKKGNCVQVTNMRLAYHSNQIPTNFLSISQFLNFHKYQANLPKNDLEQKANKRKRLFSKFEENSISKNPNFVGFREAKDEYLVTLSKVPQKNSNKNLFSTKLADQKYFPDLQPKVISENSKENINNNQIIVDQNKQRKRINSYNLFLSKNIQQLEKNNKLNLLEKSFGLPQKKNFQTLNISLNNENPQRHSTKRNSRTNYHNINMTQNNPKFFLDKITRNENCKKSKNSFRDHDHDHTHAHKTKTTNSEGYEKFKIEKMTPNHQIMEKRNNDFTWITNSDEKRKKNRHLLTKNKNKEHLISQIIKNSLDNNYYFIPNQKKIILNKPPLNISYSHSFKNPGKNHLQKKVRSSQFHKVSLFFSLSNDPW